MRPTLMAAIALLTLGAACSTSGNDQMTADQSATTTSVADRRDGAPETTDGPGSATSPTGQPDAVAIVMGNREGIGHDDRVIHLATFSATREHLAGLEAGDVTITVAR